MKLTKRRSLLMLIDIVLSFQCITFAVMIYFYGYEDWIDFKYIPFVVYAVINATVLVAAICLYIGIFRLSNVWTIIGLLLLLFVLHGLFAMLLIIYTRGGEKQRQARLLSPKAPYPESTLRTGLFLGLWLFPWSFVFTRMTFFFITMQDFKRHPTFVRNSAHLIRAISSVGRERSRVA